LTTKSFSTLVADFMTGLGFGAVAGLGAPAAPQKHPTPPPRVVPTRYDQDRFLAAPITASGQRLILFIEAGLGGVMFGLSALGALPLRLFLTVPALLFLGALAVRRSASGLPDAPWSPEMSRVFRQAVAGETVGILSVFAVAMPLRRPEWILPLVALAVGLHFLPLAHAFQRPLYYLTGVALCLVCLVTFAMPPHLGVSHLQGWRLVAGLGAGAVLWVSALMMLIQSWIGLRSFSQAQGSASGV